MVNKFFLVMLCLTVFSVFSASSSSASDPKNEDKTGQKAFEATHKIDLNKEDIIKHLPRLIGEGLFPGLTKDDYFAEDITRATSGTSRQQIILLGIHRRPIPNSDTDASASDSNATGRKILYILKNINDNGEIANIKEA